jgi:hypothetical protein
MERHCHVACLENDLNLCCSCRKGVMIKCVLCAGEGVDSASCTYSACEKHRDNNIRDCWSTGEVTGFVFSGLFCDIHANKLLQIANHSVCRQNK